MTTPLVRHPPRGPGRGGRRLDGPATGPGGARRSLPQPWRVGDPHRRLTASSTCRPINGGGDLPAANGDDRFELPLPATFVIDTDGTVTWRFADADYTKRAEPDDVVVALRSL